MNNTAELLTFDSLGLKEEILNTLNSIGHTSPTPIQEKTIPLLIKGGDLLGQAQTGTGKTGAFALPILNQIDLKNKTTQALVIAPTRELAVQVAEAFKTYAKNLSGFVVAPVYGGASMVEQLRILKRGAHVVVGTPGRLIDHLNRRTLKLDNIKTFVLDEADEMLKMGFKEDIESILEKAPSDRQIVLFSATMPKEIRRVAQRHQNNAKEVIIKSATQTVDTVEQSFWPVSKVGKFQALRRILEVHEFTSMLVFTKTKFASVEVADWLRDYGYKAACLNGDLSQSDRERVVGKLKNGNINIVVATDIAARGLHVDGISHVVNYDMPQEVESYVHRIGRTGRMGEKGQAILFVNRREERMLKTIERVTKQRIKPFDLPTQFQIDESRLKTIKGKIIKAAKKNETKKYQDLILEVTGEEGISALDIAAALVNLLEGNNEKKHTESNVVELFPKKKNSRDRSDRKRRGRGARGNSRSSRGGSRDKRGGKSSERKRSSAGKSSKSGSIWSKDRSSSSNKGSSSGSRKKGSESGGRSRR